MDEIVAFARARNTRWAPCYNLVSRWLIAQGVENVPSDSQARHWWLDGGPEDGLAAAAQRMGLIEHSEPQMGDVAVLDQSPGPEPILGLVASDGFCVARSFGVLAVWKPKVIRSWGVVRG